MNLTHGLFTVQASFEALLENSVHIKLIERPAGFFQTEGYMQQLCQISRSYHKVNNLIKN